MQRWLGLPYIAVGGNTKKRISLMTTISSRSDLNMFASDDLHIFALIYTLINLSAGKT